MIITACSESIQKHFPLNPNYQNCFLQTRQALYLKHYQKKKKKKLQHERRNKLLFLLLCVRACVPLILNKRQQVGGCRCNFRPVVFSS